ncbi:MAG: hypothetical protein ABI461_19955 [Polyangiaceae bacterium]
MTGMGVWFDRNNPGRSALRVLPFLLMAGLAVTSVTGALRARRPHGNATDIFTGNAEVSVDSISQPVNSASIGAVDSLDPNGLGPAGERTRELPVWPPPPRTSAVDPAANGMLGAPPMHVEWPGAVPSAHAKSPPASSQKPADKKP